MRPNGMRLSCGAEREGSQTESYHTARGISLDSLGTGADSFKRMLGCPRSEAFTSQRPVVPIAPSRTHKRLRRSLQCRQGK